MWTVREITKSRPFLAKEYFWSRQLELAGGKVGIKGTIASRMEKYFYFCSAWKKGPSEVSEVTYAHMILGTF